MLWLAESQPGPLLPFLCPAFCLSPPGPAAALAKPRAPFPRMLMFNIAGAAGEPVTCSCDGQGAYMMATGVIL